MHSLLCALTNNAICSLGLKRQALTLFFLGVLKRLETFALSVCRLFWMYEGLVSHDKFWLETLATSKMLPWCAVGSHVGFQKTNLYITLLYFTETFWISWDVMMKSHTKLRSEEDSLFGNTWEEKIFCVIGNCCLKSIPAFWTSNLYWKEMK